MRIGRVLLLCGLTVAALPAPALADGYFAPFIGANFGGDVGRPLNTARPRPQSRGHWRHAGRDGRRRLRRRARRQLHARTSTRGWWPAIAGGGNLVTFVPALVLGVPLGGQNGPGIRPFVLAGAGLVRRNFDAGTLTSFSQNDLAYTLGGGVMGFFSDHIGIRGDIRYIRNFRVDDFGLAAWTSSAARSTSAAPRAGIVFRF